jgi:hypothetical protein
VTRKRIKHGCNEEWRYASDSNHETMNHVNQGKNRCNSVTLLLRFCDKGLTLPRPWGFGFVKEILRLAMPKQETDCTPLSGNEQLQLCAERAREAERLAQEAEAEEERLRKEMKHVRKAYKKAKQLTKEAAKTASKARTELSGCLDGAFRQLAQALQKDPVLRVNPSSNEPPAVAPGYTAGKAEVLSLPSAQTPSLSNAAG